MLDKTTIGAMLNYKSADHHVALVATAARDPGQQVYSLLDSMGRDRGEGRGAVIGNIDETLDWIRKGAVVIPDPTEGETWSGPFLTLIRWNQGDTTEESMLREVRAVGSLTAATKVLKDATENEQRVLVAPGQIDVKEAVTRRIATAYERWYKKIKTNPSPGTLPQRRADEETRLPN